MAFERKDIPEKLSTQFLNDNPDVSYSYGWRAKKSAYIASIETKMAANKKEAARLAKEVETGKASESDKKRLLKLQEIIKNQRESIVRETDRLQSR